MASKVQIEARVLAFFRSNWNHVVKGTNLRSDLLLKNEQVLDIGIALAMELGCDPTKSQIVACTTVGELIALLQNTRFTAALAAIKSVAGHPQLAAAVKRSRQATPAARGAVYKARTQSR